MCMEDVRIGRKTSSRDFIVNAINTGVVEVLPGSPHRYSLVFNGPQSGRITLSTNPAVTLDNGITITNASGPLMLDIMTNGDIVRKPWYCIGSIASVLSVIETILPEKADGT